MNNRNVKILSPFVLCCQKVIPLAFDESMSYYECLCSLYNYIMNNLSPAINENADAVTELQNYVTHYFDNLDVQEEINNKLDEMAESGELEEIIQQYLNLITNLVFNTVNDMKNAENVINGIYVKTMGFYEIGDGGSAYYKIRNITNQDVVDEHFIIALNNENLVAEFTPLSKDIHSKQIGLKGDDITDETIYIQKFFDYKNNYEYNKIFDSGIYVISSTINVKGKDEQNGEHNDGFKNGFATIKFNDASFHHINAQSGDYSFKFYKFWYDSIDGFSITRNSGAVRILFSGCANLLFKNFEVKNIEINTDPALIPEELRYYSCSEMCFENGYLRGQLIINPYNQDTNYINVIDVKNTRFFSYGYDSCVVLKKSFSKQQIVFYNCEMFQASKSAFDVEERQVNPYLATGVGSCSIICINNYYDSNIPTFKNGVHNNVRFNEFGSRYSGNELQNESYTTEEYFNTTKIGISSNHVRNQLPISNLNLCYNGTIKNHTTEGDNAERLFGVSTTDITKTFVEKSNQARYNWVRRLTFNNTNNTFQIAQASAFHYTGVATVGLVFEVISGGCDIKFTVGYVNQQYEVLKKENIKSGLNIFTYTKQDQIFEKGAWADVRLLFENLEPNTVIDIYEVGIQSGEIYLLNAMCKGD